MLNCCIKHKLKHQQKLKTPNIKTHSSDTAVSHSHSSPSSPDVDFHTPISSLREPAEQQPDQDAQSSSEDEFYEALEDVPQHEVSGMEISEMDNVQESSDGQYHTDDVRRTITDITVDSDGARRGVLRQCGDLVLVATGRPLCIPITQVGGVLSLCDR